MQRKINCRLESKRCRFISRTSFELFRPIASSSSLRSPLFLTHLLAPLSRRSSRPYATKYRRRSSIRKFHQPQCTEQRRIPFLLRFRRSLSCTWHRIASRHRNDHYAGALCDPTRTWMRAMHRRDRHLALALLNSGIHAPFFARIRTNHSRGESGNVGARLSTSKLNLAMYNFRNVTKTRYLDVDNNYIGRHSKSHRFLRQYFIDSRIFIDNDIDQQQH